MEGTEWQPDLTVLKRSELKNFSNKNLENEQLDILLSTAIYYTYDILINNYPSTTLPISNDSIHWRFFFLFPFSKSIG